MEKKKTYVSELLVDQLITFAISYETNFSNMTDRRYNAAHQAHSMDQTTLPGTLGCKEVERGSISTGGVSSKKGIQ